MKDTLPCRASSLPPAASPTHTCGTGNTFPSAEKNLLPGQDLFACKCQFQPIHIGLLKTLKPVTCILKCFIPLEICHKFKLHFSSVTKT